MEGAIVALALVIAVVILAFLGVKTVPEGFNFVVERLGKYHQTLRPGLSFIIPFVDTVRARVSMMETVLDVPAQEVITKDNARITADGVVFFQIFNAPKSTYEVANLQRALLNLSMTNIRTVMGSMDLDALLSQRDEINAMLLKAVDEATAPWGVKVVRIEVLDIEPPADLVASMARQLKSERDRRAVILEAEGDRQSTVLRAQGELEAAKLQAEARERLALAEAKATQVVSEAVAKGDIQALNYFVAQKYTEALQAMATSPNQKTLILPIEATAPIGALAGIAELVSGSFKDGGPSGGGGGGTPKPKPKRPSGSAGSPTGGKTTLETIAEQTYQQGRSGSSSMGEASGPWARF
ncbi:MAG: SPFH/Band 7/PHB domain protein [Alphaproteobacteria bacterium]|nr:SPFH/Band 7/PHB domain protein [Alphaproteobacteria bacterium SS10]